ncbi:MAG TPA: methyltransferase domain-containing protein [Pirellulales bacterium]|nr:methyltransferase domain-containing protein [Pirellulales bacterium]
MDTARIALVFDDRTRPETTGFYCRRALESLAQVEFFHPECLAQAPDGRLSIDDGFDYAWPAELRPAAYWAIDTHLNFERSLRRAANVDFVFAAQRDGAEQLRAAGIASARWLPLACDPQMHRPHDVPKRFDVAFVGHLLDGQRCELARLIQRHFRRSFFGQAYFDEMAAIYSAARVAFNRSVQNDINMRVFEALACGPLLLTNDLADNGQNELFQDGVHLATYLDREELLDKLHYYLCRETVISRIAAAGRAEVLQKHTYGQRMSEILKTVGLASSSHPTGSAAEACFDDARDATQPVPYRDQEDHDASYFNFARPELLARVPDSAGRVLEVGCGAGRLGEGLKARQACEVVGVERNRAAAAQAAERLDRVYTGNIERMELPFVAGEFDCIVCGDVLEHLNRPERLLTRARQWLAPGGRLVASVPNVRHHSVVNGLLAGNWTYEPAGLLDTTHRQFFTRRGIEDLFKGCGYTIKQLGVVPGPGHDEWQKQGCPGQLRVAGLAVDGLARDEAEEFFVYQYLVVVEPAAGAEKRNGTESRRVGRVKRVPPLAETRPAPERRPEMVGLASSAHPTDDRGVEAGLPACLLLMITYNRLDYTRLALEAILRLDYPRLKIVIWDNASSDGTVDYLRRRLVGNDRVRLIASPHNRGVVAPMNEIWQSDREAELLAKIDNDTLVPDDWLRRLAECHTRSERFGVLSGFHFRAEGEALADERRVHRFDGVALLRQPYVGGCAVMIRRAVYEAAGPIASRQQQPSGPFMEGGWTAYQQRLGELGYINGYPWPLIHVEHMEDTRSAYCIRTPEHEAYKHALRGVGLEEFTRELCVWQPI